MLWRFQGGQASPKRRRREEVYDVIVLGTGLKECIISGLLSVQGKKVLHMDRNTYYGGESASLNLNQLFDQYKGGAVPPKELGPSREYNLDLIPKFMMANGKLVQALVKTDVTKYLEFKAVEGAYVLGKGGAIYKVPATDGEALKSPLMGLFEKRRARAFFLYVQDYEVDDPKTHKGHDLDRLTMSELYAAFGLEANTIEFIGHCLALERDDAYLAQPARRTVEAVQLYSESMARFDGGSPFIYPLYGLGELPQAFARLSAVYGGTYMLGQSDATVVLGEDGVVQGVRAGGQLARCRAVVGDPSYFPQQVTQTGRVRRALCILNHPIPNTNDAFSCQIILPAKQLGRRTDVYIFCVSYAHHAAAPGRWIACVSALAETEDAEKELATAMALLGPVEQQASWESAVLAPTDDGAHSRCFISESFDETSHFETTMSDVQHVYRRLTGQELDLSEAAE